MAEGALSGANLDRARQWGKPKKEKDEGLLASTLGKAVDFGTAISPVGLAASAVGKDVLSEEDANANIMSAVDFVDPRKLLPAVVGAGIQQSKALPSMAATLAAGGDINRLEELSKSPIGFAIDAENIKRQNELFNRREGAGGTADKFNALLGSVSPVAQTMQQSFAETGLRGGAAVGAGITQTGLAGPRLTPNQAAELIGVPSYGQAMESGQAGSMLLGDILNVAPALKGAGYGSKVNPLAGTTAGSEIAKAGAALEAAPLAPYFLPARGLSQAVQRATVSGTAFPRLAGVAEAGIPVASRAAERIEAGAQLAGRKVAGTKVRGINIREQGIINRSPEWAPQFKKLEELIDDTAKEVKTDPSKAALLDDYVAQYSDLRNQAKAEAMVQTKYKAARWADQQAKKLGVDPERLHPTTALGRVIEEVDAELSAVPEYTSPGGRTLSEVREFNPREMAAPAPRVEAQPYLGEALSGLRTPTAEVRGISPEAVARGQEFAPSTGFQSSLFPEGEQAISGGLPARPVSAYDTGTTTQQGLLGSKGISQEAIARASEPVGPVAQGSLLPSTGPYSLAAEIEALKAPVVPAKGISQEAIDAARTPSVRILEDQLEGIGPTGPSEALVEASRGVEPASVSQRALPGQVGTEAATYSKPIREALKASDKVDSTTAVRNIPEDFTDKLIESHVKGLEPPKLPEGLGGKALEGYETFMKAWKDQVLALRPAWHTTNIVGNVMSAMLLGEVSPIWFAQNVGRIMEEMKTPRDLTGMSMGRGIGAEHLASNIGKAPKTWKKNPYGKLVDTSYKFNQAVDDFSHTAVALSKFDDLIARGVPVSEARMLAEEFSLKTMGDFGNMTTPERKLVKRVSPFYPWYKHQAKATFRFPMESPGRFLQSQAIANRLTPGQETPEGAEFLGRFTPLGGGRFLSVGGDIGVGDPSASPLLNPKLMASSLTPAAQIPLALAGFDPRKGGAMQAAPGQSFLSGAKGYLTNQVATTKLGADLYDMARGEGGLVRGSTRAPIVADGRPIADSKRGTPLLPFLTGLSVQEPDLKGARTRSRKAEKTEKKQANNYEKAVKKRPKS